MIKTITSAPPAPQSGNGRDEYVTKADNFFIWEGDMINEFNEASSDMEKFINAGGIKTVADNIAPVKEIAQDIANVNAIANMGDDIKVIAREIVVKSQKRIIDITTLTTFPALSLNDYVRNVDKLIEITKNNINASSWENLVQISARSEKVAGFPNIFTLFDISIDHASVKNIQFLERNTKIKLILKYNLSIGFVIKKIRLEKKNSTAKDYSVIEEIKGNNPKDFAPFTVNDADGTIIYKLTFFNEKDKVLEMLYKKIKVVGNLTPKLIEPRVNETLATLNVATTLKLEAKNYYCFDRANLKVKYTEIPDGTNLSLNVEYPIDSNFVGNFNSIGDKIFKFKLVDNGVSGVEQSVSLECANIEIDTNSVSTEEILYDTSTEITSNNCRTYNPDGTPRNFEVKDLNMKFRYLQTLVNYSANYQFRYITYSDGTEAILCLTASSASSNFVTINVSKFENGVYKNLCFDGLRSKSNPRFGASVKSITSFTSVGLVGTFAGYTIDLSIFMPNAVSITKYSTLKRVYTKTITQSATEIAQNKYYKRVEFEYFDKDGNKIDKPLAITKEEIRYKTQKGNYVAWNTNLSINTQFITHIEVKIEATKDLAKGIKVEIISYVLK